MDIVQAATIAAAPPLSAQIQDAARTLAGRINTGWFSGLDELQRSDLRELSMTMASWADRVATMEAQRALSLPGVQFRMACRQSSRLGWSRLLRVIGVQS